MWAGLMSKGLTVMSQGFDIHEEKVFNANFTNWIFFDDH